MAPEEEGPLAEGDFAAGAGDFPSTSKGCAQRSQYFLAAEFSKEQDGQYRTNRPEHDGHFALPFGALLPH
ncbi:MAG: hypothetical protein WCU88_01940 [Elusimicrobiota bacterium]|jgi:hypothetical protein